MIFPLKVFCKWREIAMTMRQKVFDDDMEEEIDIFDIEVCDLVHFPFNVKKILFM